ncbi:outer membrane lipoprotein carrier protein LolA [Parvularcula sp. IMCC14364]|uniref:LolA family protein n=1 Tax=Parvularcula sp. IMCC14364 TaxID=3067902 RepID=UPI0027419CD8|nr:outer membrane lipoprotein carrier protein LolA [Parvularcula sp. IMCC14364]
MIISDIFAPCMSVFAVAAVEAAPVSLEPAAVAAPVIVAQVTADDLNAAQISEPEPQPQGMQAPYSAEVQPLTVPTVESDFSYQTGPLAYEDRTDEEVFAMAVTSLRGIETMSADFIQTAPSGNITTGQLQLSRPGRLRFEYDDPNPTLIVATQGLVYVHDADLETTDSYPVNRTPLKFLLNRNVQTEDARLKEVLRSEAAVNLILESTDVETQGEMVLTFDAPDMQLRRWAVVDEAGNYTVVDLDNVRNGVRIPNNAFRIPEAGGSFVRDR